jgi:hypothetical protein
VAENSSAFVSVLKSIPNTELLNTSLSGVTAAGGKGKMLGAIERPAPTNG